MNAAVIGSYAHEGELRTLCVARGDGGRFLVVERRFPPPHGSQVDRVLQAYADRGDALRNAEAILYAAGGLVGQTPTSITCGRVPPKLARSLFGDDGMRRYVHVVAAGRADRGPATR